MFGWELNSKELNLTKQKQDNVYHRTEAQLKW